MLYIYYTSYTHSAYVEKDQKKRIMGLSVPSSVMRVFQSEPGRDAVLRAEACCESEEEGGRLQAGEEEG